MASFDEGGGGSPLNKFGVPKIETPVDASSSLAWGELQDSFFAPIKLDPARADGIYPYQLLVVDVTKGNSIVGQNSFSIDNTEVVKYQSNTGGVQYSLTTGSSGWKVTLPITPQQLSITDQFSINTSATMRGVVEEHNGVKFKMISASGTTGIWPTRDRQQDPPSDPSIPTFGGALSGVSAAFESAKSSFNSLVSGGKAPPHALNFKKEEDGKFTGYFQAQLIQQLLEQYAMAKKKAENKGWRLVFNCPKTKESFVVTPVTYTATKSQRSPGEVLFNMQFKAWKRINIGQGSPKLLASNITSIDAAFLNQLSNSLSRARSFMSASTNIIKAVRADFRKPFDILRKVTLLVKDAAGLAFTVSDLPNKIGNDIRSATKKRSNDLAQSKALFDAAFSSDGDKAASLYSARKIKETVEEIKKEDDKNEGVSGRDIERGVNGKEARNAQKVSRINKVFSNPEDNFDFFNGIKIKDLKLSPKEKSVIDDEIELNSLISVEEIKEFINEIKDLTLDLSNNFGAGDAFFAKTFGRPEPKVRATPMTVEEFELITALEDAVLQMNKLTATREFDDQRTQSPLEYVGGLADDSNIVFDSSATAKKLTPVPFGLTIQQISARYLGDMDRFNEIVTLNNLRSPYIDEDGFFYDLLTNGDGRQFNINSKENLFIGQKIKLSSNTVPVFTRKISSIEKITDENYLITVDGISNLNILTSSDESKMQAFLPGTINSQNQIYIPSTETIDEVRTFDIPYLKGDTLTGLSKVDWLLQDNGDIVIDSFGEVNLANGLTNLVQALKMKIVTQKGKILSNEEYGLGITPGINVTDVIIETMLEQLTNMITQDSRFESVDNIELTIQPPTISITIKARLANGRGVFPISFTV